MSKRKIKIGNTDLKFNTSGINSEFVDIEGEAYYKISNYNSMQPFFMSLVSHSDHWLFISSTGGLSAGRKNENFALFPYYTDDKIADSSGSTGSKTIVRFYTDTGIQLWEPFSDKFESLFQVQRNLYKNIYGNKIIFEEYNIDLQLTFRYSWQFSEKFGFVKQSTLINHNNRSVKMEILDGIQNIVPYGINSSIQNEKSNLANAYKKSELDASSGLGLFLLSSIIVDKAEPSEALKTTTVWSGGMEKTEILLSDRQIDHFRYNEETLTETDIKANVGSYLIVANIELESDQEQSWIIISEVNQDHSDVIDLIHRLKSDKQNLENDLYQDIEKGTNELKKLVGMADGLQLTNDKLMSGRHFSNVLFNIMRGGIFDNQYFVETCDLKDYISIVNKHTYKKARDFINSFPLQTDYPELILKAKETNDPDLLRACIEYLPLTFSRRHGDPSRPWNKFSIETRKEDGSLNRGYEGNWRDIFQNWEALALSYPLFIDSMVSKFLNASTIDGYNPYRITRDGIDWEVIEPDNPWSFIGYWGDHQIIYLLKLLEISYDHNAQNLLGILSQENFVYANVPYNLNSYKDILANPKDTILFDYKKEKEIQKRVNTIGSDGKLVVDKKNQLNRANLTEKLLVTLLAKFTNFIPEAGIWLNTQRPEWNDANNALVGNGVSMVTLYYMRRFVDFCHKLFNKSAENQFSLNSPVAELFSQINQIFISNQHILKGKISDKKRKEIMDSLGIAGETYRSKAYKSFDGETKPIELKDLLSFFTLSLQFIDHSIAANKRKDGLYHSYNLVKIGSDKAEIDGLYEMLEGQTAVLSSGYLKPDQSLDVLDALKNSKIFREDQYSYMLYPDRELPRFLDKNNIPESFINQSRLAQSLLKVNNTSILRKDILGGYHFNGVFTNAESLKEALFNLDDQTLVAKELKNFLAIYEELFKHRYFTGRSGTFYGYEGLGSIYWHMVSKLLLATQENIYAGKNSDAKDKVIGELIDHYYEIRAGIGINKSPELYGAFPTDPYSHTPRNKGAQQPGMTGQVKEDILSRWAELGVFVSHGCLHFSPLFLNQEEFLTKKQVFSYFSIAGKIENLNIEKNELIFTYCQVPVIYRKGNLEELNVEYVNGDKEIFKGNKLPKSISEVIFSRSGKINLIRAQIHSGFVQ